MRSMNGVRHEGRADAHEPLSVPFGRELGPAPALVEANIWVAALLKDCSRDILKDKDAFSCCEGLLANA